MNSNAPMLPQLEISEDGIAAPTRTYIPSPVNICGLNKRVIVATVIGIFFLIVGIITLSKNIDECSDGIDECGDNSACVDNDGSYTCPCDNGYIGDGRVSCTNIDECYEQSHQCHSRAYCYDTIGSYYCTCRNGFSGSGRSCRCRRH